MNLLTLSEQIVERYRRYLLSTFYFKDPVLRESFREAMSKEYLSKGPYLEATPVFRRGMKTSELFKELLINVPDEGFLNATAGDRPLYLHQEEAIRKVFGEGHNVVVATGTASGKTEAFLYSILLHLYREFQLEQLGAGVRALILYPMNALANDQRERLGEIAKQLITAGSPFRFTFGQYIGETPENEDDSARHARDHIDNRLPGELVLRREMQENPPHILLTNYSMLEYLLIRPHDSLLFDDGRARWWTFLVLDEAHQYRGSKGIEMSMLVRRLKRRLREGGRDESFKCIATSATIAGSVRDRADVARFASELFGEEFREENVILGTTESISDSSIEDLCLEEYGRLRQALDTKKGDHLSEIMHNLHLVVPHHFNVTEKVGYILQHDRRSTKLRQLLELEPKHIRKIADELFQDLPKDARAESLSELIGLLIQAKDASSGAPLLSARYHLFLRSLEGAFVSYFPQMGVFLERGGGTEKGVTFEVALCRECGQHYIVGRCRGGKLQEAIRDIGHPDFKANFFKPVQGNGLEIDNDEEDIATKKKLFRLCVQCGAMAQIVRAQDKPICEHTESILVEEQEGVEEREDQVPRCSACGYQAPDPVREVVHGTDGPHAVIATALYQRLPKERRKVLAFADGRQEAAFFAWYLQNSYMDILNRNLILKTVNIMSHSTQAGLSLRELVTGLRDTYRRNGVFPPATGDLELRHKAWHRLYCEFLTDEPRISLEGAGLLRWYVKWPEKFRVPNILLNHPWSLTEQQARDLIFILLDFMRADRAVELQTENGVSLNWSDLGLQASQMSILSIKKGKLRYGERRWGGAHGKRVQFLAKLLMRKGVPERETIEKAMEALAYIWEAIKDSDKLMPSEHRFLLPIGDGRRLNPDWWRAFRVSDNDTIYQCDTCARLQSTSVGGACTRHRCPGTVRRIQAKEAEEIKASHYRVLYEEDLPGVLRVEEHTAQIDKEKAREFQRDFRDNKIHVLSCSTTFELGVDLGNLDTIFLRNVPPETFNYSQRVGRAGRRSGFPGFAITFCRRNPHDLYHGAHPQERILKGMVRPPIVSLQNEKIATRHIAATALSCFFRKSRDRFENISRLFGDMEHPTGVESFLNFLQQNKAELKESLRSIVPSAMASKVGINNGSWIESIAGENSRFALAEAEISSDFRILRELERACVTQRDYRNAEWASRRAETIQKEDTLSFLSRKAIIPKYGFPVDVVELDTQNTTNF